MLIIAGELWILRYRFRMLTCSLVVGDVPKEAWINPQGGHLGRQVRVWPDPVIFRQVIIPYLVRKLDVGSNEAAK